MPAPKGNKYAVGNSGGKAKYDLDREAKDLLEWSLRDDALRLYGFTNPKDYDWDDLDDFAKRSEVFSLALKKAKKRLALRREDYVSKGLLKECVYNKTMHIYDKEYRSVDKELKDEEQDRKLKLIEAEIRLKASSEIKTTEQQQSNHEDIVSAIMSIQSERKIADINIKAAAKS